MLNSILDFLKNIFVLKYAPNKDDEINLLKAEKLYWAISLVIEFAVYQRDSIGRKATYCNLASYDLFDARCKAIWNVMVQEGASLKRPFPMGQTIKAYDYDIRPIMPNNDYNDILSAPIPKVFDKAIKEAKKGSIRLLTQAQAQEKANKGIPCMIISKKFNHVAISCPHLIWADDLGKMVLKPYNPELGCFTGNAGWINSLMYMSDPKGFGSINWKSETDILYIQFRQFTTEEFDD